MAYTTPSRAFNRAMVLLDCPVRALPDEHVEATMRRLDAWVDAKIGQATDLTPVPVSNV
jgi:hypothetical protein